MADDLGEGVGVAFRRPGRDQLVDLSDRAGAGGAQQEWKGHTRCSTGPEPDPLRRRYRTATEHPGRNRRQTE
ncbi:MAG TPA: hypothetical protein VHF27_02975 [Acidimicrobiales bacterium]|nr:hypothetical protein [Acidimicrobiales bacterium]